MARPFVPRIARGAPGCRRRRATRHAALALQMLAVVASCSVEPKSSAAHDPSPARATAIAMPGGERGIGFDDVRYSTQLRRVLVPAGRTGNLDLVDPTSGQVETIGGFGAQSNYTGGHGDGTTSVDEGLGSLFAIDRTSKKLFVVDASARAIVASAPLAAEPDYVRFVDATREAWVTEPDAEQIEVFELPPTKSDAPRRVATIDVKGGPESLVIDGRRARAYSHLWSGSTVAVDLRARTIVATWSNGCEGSRGLALDEERGFLFVGCAEGRVTVLDVAHDGAILSQARVGAGVDIIEFDARRRHVYVPSAKTATLSILAVTTSGELTLLGTLPAVEGAHCATTDGNGRVFVGDPKGGRLLVLVDAL